jgi:hypothetical protein
MQLIMSDIAEPFVPDSAQLVRERDDSVGGDDTSMIFNCHHTVMQLLKLSEHKSSLQSLLERIPSMFVASRSNESCAGAGIEVWTDR